MRVGARITIAVVALIWALGFLMTALAPGVLLSDTAMFYALTILCLVIAISCYWPQSHPFTFRMLGAAIFSVSVAYGLDSWDTQNIGRALSAYLIWGVPLGYWVASQKPLLRG